MGAVREQALTAYLAWLEGRPLAPRSREAYGHQARRYLAWLGDRSPVDGDPLADGDARDWAVRDYKRHLKAVERWKPASVNLALAALDSFYTQRELGRPIVRREELSKSAPRAIREDEQRRLLRMGERRLIAIETRRGGCVQSAEASPARRAGRNRRRASARL